MKFVQIRQKIAIASHEDLYMTICVKIFSEGRRQDFSIDHKIFQTDQKIANASNYNVYQKFSVNIFSEGRRQGKYALSASVHPS